MLVYSEIVGDYDLAKWTAARGWVSLDNGRGKVVTHWYDWDLPLIYEIKDEVDMELAKKYGFKDSYP